MHIPDTALEKVKTMQHDQEWREHVKKVKNNKFRSVGDEWRDYMRFKGEV